MTEVPVPTPSPTGIDSVDRVLDLVAGLAERPLEEHAKVFESAHAELRRTLDDPPSAVPPQPESHSPVTA